MRSFGRLLIVVAMSVALLAASASIALAVAGPDGPLSAIAAQQAPTAGGSAGIIRTIGVLGIAGMWALRGYSSIKRSRHERERPAEDDGPEADADLG